MTTKAKLIGGPLISGALARGSWEVRSPPEPWWTGHTGEGRHGWRWQGGEVGSDHRMVVGESGEKSTLSRVVHSKNHFVAMVPCAMYLSRYTCCTRRPEMTRVLLPSTSVMTAGRASKSKSSHEDFLQAQKALARVEVHMPWK